MKFSTKTLAEIGQLLVAEFREQIQEGEIQPDEIEQNLRSVLQAAGQESFGAMATAKARTAWLSGSWDSLVTLPLAA